MLRMMADEEPAETVLSMTTMTGLAGLACLAEQFGYQYLHLRRRRCYGGDILGTAERRGGRREGAVMAESPQSVTVVALLAEPDAPTEVAQRMARELPARLADASGGHRRFDVKVASEPFTAPPPGPRT
ncbi:hypothetical protein ACIRG4_05865 [Streptomyces sp. NPDC102395]|uniref:hypothetical protein n=1 Tax=Streptomyces sp. NPDC102395 TaxID=3366168 RepID=UPI003824FCBF